MAKFKCIHSGNVFVFESEYDIQGLRKHPDYTEVVETKEADKEPLKADKNSVKRTYNKVKSKDE